MTARILQLSTHCPVCRPCGIISAWVRKCGWCQGLGIVYTALGHAASVRRKTARDIVAATMRQYEGIP